VSRRVPEEAEEAILGSDRIILSCTLPGGGEVELALADSALTGFLAWMEAAPPGSQMGWASLFKIARRPASTARRRGLDSPPGRK
jgi:hypothetical protein